MSRFGRRTFLASSAGVAAGAAVAAGADAPLQPRRRRRRRRPGRREPPRRSAPVHSARPALTVNGLTNPVGIDPDGCSFAWTLQATGRAAVQGAFRIVVRRTDPGHAGPAWDSGPVQSARQAFVAYDGPALAADAAYRVDRPVPRRGGQMGADVRAVLVHHRAQGIGLEGELARSVRRRAGNPTASRTSGAR